MSYEYIYSVFSLTAIYIRSIHGPADSVTDHAVRVQQDTDCQVAVEDEVAGVESGKLDRLEDLLAGVLAGDGAGGPDDLAGVAALLPDVGVAGGGVVGGLHAGVDVGLGGPASWWQLARKR